MARSSAGVIPAISEASVTTLVIPLSLILLLSVSHMPTDQLSSIDTIGPRYQPMTCEMIECDWLSA
jgi:hypothetical protein